MSQAAEYTAPGPIQNIAREVHAIKGTQIQMAQAFEQNTRAFHDAFQIVDSQMHVLQRAFNDLVQGNLLKKEDGSVDFAEYVGQYWGMVGLVMFVEALKVALPASEETESEPADNVVVFGGNG